MECADKDCQICKFVEECCPSVAHSVTVTDILERRVPMPFTNVEAWRQCQQSCPDLRRAFWFLQQCTRPSKKSHRSADLKTYLRYASLDNNGLMVVKRPVPFPPTQKLTIVPKTMVHGLHIRLHPPVVRNSRKCLIVHFTLLHPLL